MTDRQAGIQSVLELGDVVRIELVRGQSMLSRHLQGSMPLHRHALRFKARASE